MSGTASFSGAEGHDGHTVINIGAESAIAACVAASRHRRRRTARASPRSGFRTDAWRPSLRLRRRPAGEGRQRSSRPLRDHRHGRRIGAVRRRRLPRPPGAFSPTRARTGAGDSESRGAWRSRSGRPGHLFDRRARQNSLTLDRRPLVVGDRAIGRRGRAVQRDHGEGRRWRDCPLGQRIRRCQCRDQPRGIARGGLADGQRQARRHRPTGWRRATG